MSIFQVRPSHRIERITISLRVPNHAPSALDSAMQILDATGCFFSGIKLRFEAFWGQLSPDELTFGYVRA